MAYKFTETAKVKEEFGSVFGANFSEFYDGLMSLAMKQLTIDIVKFDKWLQRQHGDYLGEGKSLNDAVREHYGERGVRLIDALTGTDSGGDGPREELVEHEGLTLAALRTMDGDRMDYKPYYENGTDKMDLNQQILELMTLAAYDALQLGQVAYGGSYTAAEMAGTVGWLHQYIYEGEYMTVGIKAGGFQCSFHIANIFEQIAEWEGVMNLAPKKQHRFAVEGKELPAGTKLKPYSRCHGYKPRTISLAAENDRIAKKFETLGRVAQNLTSEGMRRAMSVKEAARLFDHMSYDMRDICEQAMAWKLWKDYGRQPGAHPIPFTRSDFKDGPEIWKQPDRDYTASLVTHFQRMLDESPKPEWPAMNDTVMLRGREKMAKKYQGKFLCEGVQAHLSTYGDRIEWYALVRTKKWDCESFSPSQLEPAPTEPKKKPKSDKPKAKGKSDKPKTTKPKPTDTAKQEAQPAMSLEDRLREALRKQMAEYRVAA